MMIHTPFLVTGEEGQGLAAAYGSRNLLFQPEEHITVGDYVRMIHFIECRRDYSVCLRLSTSFDYGVLELPITKAVTLLVYLPVDDEENPRLASVTSYNPLTWEMKELWRADFLPESCRFNYRPLLS